MMSNLIKDSFNCDYIIVEEFKDNVKVSRIGIRHLQVFILFLCLSITIGTRMNMSIAIVSMTTPISNQSTTEIFDWNKKTQSVVLSSFFWGYLAIQIPAGLICTKFGGKLPVAVSMALNGVMSLLTPIGTHLGGYKVTSAIRVIQGLAQGLILPSIHTLLGVWVPVEERGRLGAFTLSGLNFGPVAFMVLASILGASSFGWHSIFYTQGAISLLASAIWCYFGARNPAKHKTITKAEKLYIQNSLEQRTKKILPQAPWSQILLSRPVWGICLAHIGCFYSSQTIANEIPIYMSKIMNADIRTSGLFTALPFLGRWVLLILLSLASDWIVNRGLLSRACARKSFNTLGAWTLALVFAELSFVKDTVAAEIILILGMSLAAGQQLGFLINHMDLSPNYAGVLMAISNTCGNFGALVTPFIAGFIITDVADISHWRIEFFVSAAVCFVTNALYLILGSGHVQSWNNNNSEAANHLKNEIDTA